MSQVFPFVFATVLTLLAQPALCQVQPGDVAFGLSNSGAALTLELLRGPATGTGTAQESPWKVTPFIQSVRFDNLGGQTHNGQGNLLGVNFGSFAAGGSIYNFSTTDPAMGEGQLIGNSTDLGAVAVTKSRLASLSVSPDNSKIALNGYDTGTVVVYDYNAGDTQGGVASLEGGRESSLNILTLADTQGTVWMDNDHVLAFNTDGTLLTVNANTMTHQIVGTLPTPFAGSPNSALAYNPEVSPYVYALYSQFADVTTNTLYIVDPRADYSLVKTIDLSTSSNTARDVALDAAGNLFFSAFGSSSEGATIHVILNAAQPETLTDNSSTVWYRAGVGASFSGLDVAFGATPTPDVDLNGDGAVDAADAGLMFANWGQTGTGDLNSDSIIDAADAGILFAAWTGDAAPVSSIPEPTASGLLLLGVVAWRSLRTQG